MRNYPLSKLRVFFSGPVLQGLRAAALNLAGKQAGMDIDFVAGSASCLTWERKELSRTMQNPAHRSLGHP
jgi:hypothetical protein